MDTGFRSWLARSIIASASARLWAWRSRYFVGSRTSIREGWHSIASSDGPDMLRRAGVGALKHPAPMEKQS